VNLTEQRILAGLAPHYPTIAEARARAGLIEGMSPKGWYVQHTLKGGILAFFYATGLQKNGSMAGVLYSPERNKAAKSQVTTHEQNTLWQSTTENEVKKFKGAYEKVMAKVGVTEDENNTPPFPSSGATAAEPGPAKPLKAPAKKKKPTFAEKRVELFAHLKKEGWKVVEHLKVPHATSPDGETRLWFKTQAVYMSRGNNHTLNSARSIWADIRDLDANQFMQTVHRWAK